jgi:hypothetical protein
MEVGGKQKLDPQSISESTATKRKLFQQQNFHEYREALVKLKAE